MSKLAEFAEPPLADLYPIWILPVVAALSVNVIWSRVQALAAYFFTADSTAVPPSGIQESLEVPDVTDLPLYVGTLIVYVPAGNVTV